MSDTETLSDEFLHVRAIVLGGLLPLEPQVPRWKLEERAHAITRALMGVWVRGTVASGTIEGSDK